ncbi:hypothetical protein PM082_006415 [Marasmius tenuissimus]|nr:hypothetical protein PM082_006415 [Marasmius tenuissimus]
MRIATWNIRYDSDPKNIPLKDTIDKLPDCTVQFPFLTLHGEQNWADRRIRIAETLLNEGIDLVGLQEALKNQIDDLVELFGDDWAWVGAGRDDGKEKGEYCPIFYKKSALTLVSEAQHFWLSSVSANFIDLASLTSSLMQPHTLRTIRIPRGPTPYLHNRTLHYKQSTPGTPNSFSVLNTHLDDRYEGQRNLGASLLLQRAKYEAYKNNGGVPVFVIGDFNRRVPSFRSSLPQSNSPFTCSEATGPASGGYRTITGSATPVAINERFAKEFDTGDEGQGFKMLDLRGHTPRLAVSKNFATWTSFNSQDTSEWMRLDFIFGGSNMKWKSTAYKVTTTLQDDGLVTSDHRPVFADIFLQQ